MMLVECIPTRKHFLRHVGAEAFEKINRGSKITHIWYDIRPSKSGTRLTSQIKFCVYSRNENNASINIVDEERNGEYHPEMQRWGTLVLTLL
ncbi:hypothetical protein CEXT_27741 [Caerostris extrusa]|uniref:Uncharacterized protein n=1 Tax=Caerostris extrusa TaxID=172846 RepID=A0AAV4Y9U6_CAEEX|nr:hypothetical protein CEXT_27741 [Caerostris extrusa]